LFALFSVRLATIASRSIGCLLPPEGKIAK
jgi:hypothetical protein